MGAAILWIVFFHSGIQIPTDTYLIPIAALKATGFAGVDIFFLLSGIGISFSLSKNTNKLLFYKRRISRLIPAFWASILFLTLLNILETHSVSITNTLLSLFCVDFFVGKATPFWFVPAIVACYLLSPFIYKELETITKTKIFIGVILYFAGLYLVILFHEALLIFYTRLPAFVLGIYLGVLQNKKYRHTGIHYPNGLAINFGFSLVILTALLLTIKIIPNEHSLKNTIYWYLTCALSLPLSIVFSHLFSKSLNNIKILNASFKILGNVSLELYLTHTIIFQTLTFQSHNISFWNIARVPEYLLLTITAISLSIAFRKAQEKLLKTT